MSDENRNQLLEAMEEARDTIAALNGMKRQLVDEGWDERNAEQMVVALIARSGAQ